MAIFNQEKYKNTESSEEGGKLFSIIENWEIIILLNSSQMREPMQTMKITQKKEKCENLFSGNTVHQMK